MNIPEFLIPWLDRFYDPFEIELLQVLENKPIGKKQLIKLLGKNKTSEDRYDFDCFLERAWQRGTIKFLDDQTIAQEDFHVRFDYWALFEGWKEILTRSILNIFYWMKWMLFSKKFQNFIYGRAIAGQ